MSVGKINGNWLSFLHQYGLVALVLALLGCGGQSQPAGFSAPGIDSGSSLARFNGEINTGEVPQLAAAQALQSAPLEDTFDAVRFLQRTSFGPTLESIEQVTQLGYEQWLVQQLLLPPTFLLPLTRERSEPRWGEHINSWLRVAVAAQDQLRQRVAFALSQLFVVSDQEGLGSEQAALANYYDILIAHSFANFRSLLEEVTLSPVMGDYLSMKGNRKPDPANNIRPDENYARELLQLFSIGLVQLNQDGSPKLDDTGRTIATYEQSVVEGFAHVFTGWHFSNVDHWDYPKNVDWFNRMQAFPEQHDEAEKQLLNNVVLSAGQSPEQDLADALDLVFNHPNVAPFVSRHLISQLVTSNPSAGYIQRVAQVFNDDGVGRRGNLAAVVTAIVLDQEAHEGHLLREQTFGRLREPLLRLVALWRAFDANLEHADFRYGHIADKLAQAPLSSPTVFNFFASDFSQAGEVSDLQLRSPEFQIHHESSIIAITSTLLAHSIWHNTSNDDFNPANAPVQLGSLVALIEDTDQLLQRLAWLTLSRPMTQGLREQALYLLESRANNTAANRVEELLFLFAASPEAAIQR